MAFLLGPGLMTNPELTSRIEYIKANTQIWQLGWTVWIFAAFSFLIFTWCLRRHHVALGTNSLNKKFLSAAVVCALLAALLDFHAEIGQIFNVTELASHYGNGLDQKEFIGSQFCFMLESGTIASLLYSFASINCVLATKHDYPKWLVNIGFALFIVSFIGSGFALLATICSDHHVNPMTGIMVATNAILFPLLVLWQLGIAYKSKGETND